MFDHIESGTLIKSKANQTKSDSCWGHRMDLIGVDSHKNVYICLGFRSIVTYLKKKIVHFIEIYVMQRVLRKIKLWPWARRLLFYMWTALNGERWELTLHVTYKYSVSAYIHQWVSTSYGKIPKFINGLPRLVAFDQFKAELRVKWKTVQNERTFFFILSQSKQHRKNK